MPTQILSALAEPTRFGAMRILWSGQEHCVCELMATLDASQSRMSRHMAALKAAGLVIDRRDRQWVRFRLNPDMAPGVYALLAAAMALPETPEMPEIDERNAA